MMLILRTFFHCTLMKARYNFSCDIITWRNKRKDSVKEDINKQLRKGGQPHNFLL